MSIHNVACIGILVADAVARTVDRLPERGKLDLVDQLELYTGGCACNAAIAMARIGLDVAVIGKIGRDGFGRFLYNSLLDENVDVDGLVMDEGESTSASGVLVDSSGERSFLHCLGANASFGENDINFGIIEDSEIVFIGGTFLLPGFDGEPCARVLRKSREMGKTTVLDTAWDSRNRWMDVLKPCMEHIDIFMPSYEEAVKLSGKTEPEEIADVFLSLGVNTAVIKLGKDGCFIKSAGGERYRIPTYTHIKPVDTNGAGDCFVAGFLTGLSKGWGLYECGRFANAVGTHCVMAVGALTGIKSFDEIMDFIKNNRLEEV